MIPLRVQSEKRWSQLLPGAGLGHDQPCDPGTSLTLLISLVAAMILIDQCVHFGPLGTRGPLAVRQLGLTATFT